MKTAAKIVAVIVICLALALVVLRITGLNPIGDVPGPRNYPGLWLSGQVVNAPVTDWSFVTQYRTDKVQTRTRFLIPHSVTTGFIVYNGQLYLTSMFRAGMPFPQGKMWVSDVMRDPHVRLKFGDKLYDCVLSHVTDPDERAAVLGSRAKQFPQPTASNATSGAVPVMHLFHAVSQ
jgi:hypothetical protein